MPTSSSHRSWSRTLSQAITMTHRAFADVQLPSRVGLTHWLSGSPVIVGIIDAVVTGVAVVCEALGAGVVVRTVAGVIATLAAATTARVFRADRRPHPDRSLIRSIRLHDHCSLPKGDITTAGTLSVLQVRSRSTGT